MRRRASPPGPIPPSPSIQRRLIASVDRWWRPLDESPRTLIHNDFNPRNICLRPSGDTADGLRLCAYDWELATLGAPQHDLAELLCFVLPSDASADDLGFWVERHRAELARLTGIDIDAREWTLGFRSALFDLMLNRLPMYALVHRVRPQRFLSRVVSTWRRLYELRRSKPSEQRQECSMRSPGSFIHASNLLTYLALAAGIGAIAAAVNGSAAGAGALLAVAALADTFDGRFARLFKRTSDQQTMGVELDSLSDAIAFGAAPVASMGVLLASTGTIGRPDAWWWLAGTIYACCALTRLAAYNVTHGSGDGFVGLPAPVAALVWSSVLLLRPDFNRSIVVALITGVAMIYRSASLVPQASASWSLRCGLSR